MSSQDKVATTLLRLYKVDSARLSAILLRLLGAANLQLVEDLVQNTFEKALIHWEKNGEPANPSAWLIMTAKNNALDALRKQETRRKYADTLAPELTSNWTVSNKVQNSFDRFLNPKDEQLNMMVWLSSSDLSTDYLLPVILKMVCGLSIDAIARALLIKTGNTQKRINRAINQLKTHVFNKRYTEGDDEQLLPIEPSDKSKVLTSLYLLFNEGLNTHRNNNPESALLCVEALNLALSMSDSVSLQGADTNSLLALMHFYLAQQAAKVDNNGELVPLNLQNRALWRNQYLVKATVILADVLSHSSLSPNAYLFEALIANEHMLAKSFEDTNWKVISAYYNKWLLLTGSPMVKLNLSVAYAHMSEFDKALDTIKSCAQQNPLKNSYQIEATLCYIYGLMGNSEKAKQHIHLAKTLGMNQREVQALSSQIENLANS